MCGITGFWDLNSSRSNEQEFIVRRMADTLAHRGPDANGFWCDQEVGIALGHRRLSIIDLSPTGHQPMLSANERYVLIFNGEIYNFSQLREELAGYGHTYRGTSDTEVMLTAFMEWGIEGAVQKFNGMFAFAVWDRQERTLHLGRDRLGEKPLYYGWIDNVFLFGSELKTMRAHPAFRAKIDRGAVAVYLRHSYIPAPHSIYEGIHKLPPATVMSISIDNRNPEPIPYWSVREAAQYGLCNPFDEDEHAIIEQLDELLQDAVKMRMIADVPLGAFLSGGIDSSMIVAMMQAQSSHRVKTFTIGFHEDRYNEATYAKAVANHLSTDHTELYVSSEEAMAVIPKLPTLYDEPFADSSQIPTFLISQLARQHVTVSLSGDGGDELFGGYDRYFRGRTLDRYSQWVPRVAGKALARTLTLIPSAFQSAFFKTAKYILPKHFPHANSGQNLHRLAEFLDSIDSRPDLYRNIVSQWKKPERVVLHATELPTVLTQPHKLPEIDSFLSWMMLVDTISYLPDDILVKLDRASMGVSLESRVPLLDHRVVEFSWRVPLSMKIRRNTGKWLLRRLLYRYVPPELIERPKTGFGVPITHWLRGPLRDWAEALLARTRLEQEGIFNPIPIEQRWREHLAGDFDHHYYLWDILMFQSWLETHP